MSETLRHWLLPHHTNNQRAKLLHPTAISVIAGIFTVGQLVLNVLVARYPRVLGYAAARISPEEIVRLTNTERVSLGLATVKYDTQLSQAAAQKAADMFVRNYWAHVSPSGSQPWYFITQNNYAYRYAGENLARDFMDPESVVKAWLASPTHRENLLNSKYLDVGVAVVDGKMGGRETTLVVQMFGTRLTAGAAGAVPAVASSAVVSASVPVPAFAVTKYLSILLMGVFAAVLVVDIITVNRRQIARWTSKSFAHLAFTMVLLVAVTLLSVGQII